MPSTLVDNAKCNLLFALWDATPKLGKNNLIYTSPVPELSFLPAPYRSWTRAGERRVQDNLHAHAQNEPIKNYQVPTTLLASMCRAMPFSARALKENILFDVDIVIKKVKTKNWNVVFRGLYSYRQRLRIITLFPNIFFVLFLYVERFCKSFWKESLTRTSSSFA